MNRRIETMPFNMFTTDNDASVPLLGGEVTSDLRPTMMGNAGQASLIYLLDGATVIGSSQAAENGAWQVAPEDDLRPGQHRLFATNGKAFTQPIEFMVEAAPALRLADLLVEESPSLLDEVASATPFASLVLEEADMRLESQHGVEQSVPPLPAADDEMWYTL